MRPKRKNAALWWPLSVALLISTLTVGGAVGVLLAFAQNLPDVYRTPYRPHLTTKVFSAQGELIATLYEENRELVPLEHVPLLLRQATLAIEDARFYEHPGIDPRGILRALWENLRVGEFIQGGSTITQQLARTLFLEREKTLGRKLREMILAVRLERVYSKDEILEMYLNEVYYGEGAYGVAAAAQTYFQKRPEDLDLAECALLAGLPQAPSRYSPFTNPEGAQRRRRLVLARMRRLGFITPEQEAQANAAPLPRQRSLPYRRSIFDFRAPYFTTYAIQELSERLGLSKEAIYRGGLRVYTTVDLRLYAAAHEILRSALQRLAPQGAKQGAVVILDVRSGHILTLIGGKDFRDERGGQYNRAVQAHRQPGSAFKPIIYAAALEEGLRPSDTVSGTPTTFYYGGVLYRPRNFSPRQGGLYTLAQALQHSVNVAAVRLILEIGPPKAVEMARRLGIRAPLEPVPSLALGSIGVPPLEMATAYMPFANGGYLVEPTAILRVEDSEGRILYEAQPRPRRVLSEQTAYWMNQMLQLVVMGGTGTAARLPGWKVGGKTGTTTDNRDAWFIGFTPGVVAAVWVGNDEFQPMRSVWGATVAPIWRGIVREAAELYGEKWPQDFPKPRDVPSLLPRPRRSPGVSSEASEEKMEYQMICSESGLLANQHCPKVEAKAFLPGEAPSRVCSLHTPLAPSNPFEWQRPPSLEAPWEASLMPPSGQERVNVLICLASGKPATEYCPEVAIRSFPGDRAPEGSCPLHGPPQGE